MFDDDNDVPADGAGDEGEGDGEASGADSSDGAALTCTKENMQLCLAHILFD